MLKKKITYTDFNGNERTEIHWFHLTKLELAEMNAGLMDGGSLEDYIERLATEKNPKVIMTIFKELIQKSYGKKSEDGRRFMKSEEILKEFTESNAYEALYLELAGDAKAATEFFDGIIPSLTPEEKAEVDNYRNGLIEQIQ